MDRNFWVANSLVWGLLSVSNATASYADKLRYGETGRWLDIVPLHLLGFAPFFVATPFVFRWLEWCPERSGWRENVAAYAKLFAVWAATYVPVAAAIQAASAGRAAWEIGWALGQIPASFWVMDVVIFVGLVGVAVAITTASESRRRERGAAQLAIQNAKLQRDLAEARLQMLRAQLEPHFLFNALNSVTALVRCGRNEDAVEAIAQLSGLLRYATQAADRELVSLGEELDFVERYLRFQQIRFGDRLRFRVESSEGTDSSDVPPLLLQPLLENAVCHGVESTAGPSEIFAMARRENGRLVLRISNAPGQVAQGSAGLGIGLANTRRRLEAHFGDDFAIESGEADGAYFTMLGLPVP